MADSWKTATNNRLLLLIQVKHLQAFTKCEELTCKNSAAEVFIFNFT